MLPIQYASTTNIGVLDGQFLILLLINIMIMAFRDGTPISLVIGINVFLLRSDAV